MTTVLMVPLTLFWFNHSCSHVAMIEEVNYYVKPAYCL